MKKIILLVSLCISAYSLAGTNQKEEIRKLRAGVLIETGIPKHTMPVSVKHGTSQDYQNSVNALKEKAQSRELQTQKNSSFATQPFKVSETAKEKLDSVVYYSVSDVKESANLFTYNEKNLQIGRQKVYWNGAIQDYMPPFEEHFFEWDEKNRLTSQEFQYLNFGEIERYDYTYNDLDQIVTEITSLKYGGLTSVVPYMKREFRYNQNEIIDKAVIFEYINGEWVNYSYEEAIFNDDNVALQIEAYMWQNGEWVGQQFSKLVYEFDDAGNTTLYSYADWNNSLKDWVWVERVLCEFNENNDITSYITDFFIGGEWVRQGITITEYDDLGRKISELYSQPDESGALMPIYAIESSWESWADFPQNRCVELNYRYESDGINRVCEMEEHKYYDVIYNLVYRGVGPESTGIFQPTSETKYVYDANNNLLEERTWRYRAGVKLADIAEVSYFNEDNLCIKQEYFQGKATDTEETWHPIAKFIYEYEGSAIVRKYRYKTVDGGGGGIILKGAGDEVEWVADWGEGIDCDFTKTRDDLYAPFEYNDLFKILVVYRFSGNGQDESWLATTNHHYWSEGTTSNISEAKSIILSVYPNPTTDILYINANGENLQVSLYNLQGALLIQAETSQIDMSQLPAGIYIVDVNGTKAKVVKR